MKGIKFMIAAALLAVATSASAQFANTSKKGGAATSAASLLAQKPIHEVSFYIQDGWGLGYQMRKDINKYVAWDVVGVSYMSGFNSPADYGQVNFKLLGARLYTPSYENCRLYADLNMGYTLAYAKGIGGFSRAGVYIPGYGYMDLDDSDDDFDGGTSTSHHFGLDFGVGLQVGKHFTVGYNLNFVAPGKAKSHWAKLSYLF